MILTGINFFVQYDLFHHPDKSLAIFENITIICITIFNASMGLSCYYMAAGQLLRRREITISGFMEIFTDGSYFLNFVVIHMFRTHKTEFQIT